MSQLPQNNEDFDYNPEYAKLYQANDSLQSDVDDADDWTQPANELPSRCKGNKAVKEQQTPPCFAAFSPR